MVPRTYVVCLCAGLQRALLVRVLVLCYDGVPCSVCDVSCWVPTGT